LEFLDAAVTVLQEEGKPLHWTVVQDLALKRGYLDPFTQRDIRKNLLAGRGRAAMTGVVVKEDRGIYRLP
jgi:hypothetical protein